MNPGDRKSKIKCFYNIMIIMYKIYPMISLKDILENQSSEDAYRTSKV